MWYYAYSITGNYISTSLLHAMSVPKIQETLKQRTFSLLHNVCKASGPASALCLELLRQYLTSGTTVPGTLIHRVVNYGESPINVIFNNKVYETPVITEDGVVDSIKSMLCHENFIKPHSIEQDILKLLTRAF